MKDSTGSGTAIGEVAGQTATTTTLLNMRRKDSGTIASLPADAELRSQCIRLGLSIGSTFRCIQRLWGGTIVVETNRQEIAMGRSLAMSIGVLIEP